jgi:hypothetical protein
MEIARLRKELAEARMERDILRRFNPEVQQQGIYDMAAKSRKGQTGSRASVAEGEASEKRAPLMPSAPSGTISHVVYARFLGGQMAATLAWDSTSHLRTACPKAITT